MAAAEREDGGRPRSWERLSTGQVGDFEMFRVRRDRARSPRDGSEHTFHVAEAPDGVTVIAVTPDGRVVLVEQFRHPLREVTLELPAGVVDGGEPPLEAAARELREETGFEGEAPEPLGRIDLNPSWQVTRVHVALVRNARPSGEGKDEDAGEDTRVRLVDAVELRKKVLDGEIRSGTVVAALALWEWRAGAEDAGTGKKAP